MMKSSKVEPAQLTSHLGFWMRMISNNVSHAFAGKLASSGVTVAEWVIIREMYSNHGVTSPSVVADLTGLTRGAVSKLISRLLEKGLVLRTESKDDRRFQDIKLTAKAVNLVPKLAALADANDEEYFSCLTKPERQQLKALLHKLAQENEIKALPIE